MAHNNILKVTSTKNYLKQIQWTKLASHFLNQVKLVLLHAWQLVNFPSKAKFHSTDLD